MKHKTGEPSEIAENDLERFKAIWKHFVPSARLRAKSFPTDSVSLLGWQLGQFQGA